VGWLLDNGCPLNARDGVLHEPAIVDACRTRNPGALKAGGGAASTWVDPGLNHR